MKKIFFIILLILFIQSSFSLIDLTINEINYDNLYSGSNSYITIDIENSGDESLTIVNSTLTGIDNYIIVYSPTNVNLNQKEQIIYEVITPCSSGNETFFVNITYKNSTDIKQVDSVEKTILIKNPLNITINNLNINEVLPILTTETKKLSYTIINNGKKEIKYNITVSSTSNIYSDVLSTKGVFSINDLSNYTFTLGSLEVDTINHYLNSIGSGESGSYIITIQDKECSLNKEIITLVYESLSETSQLNLNIRVADVSYFPLIFLLLIAVGMVWKHL